MWVIPLRAMLARMVVGLNFEFNVLRIGSLGGPWGQLAWVPDNGGYRHRRQQDREAVERLQATYCPAPFAFTPPAFIVLGDGPEDGAPGAAAAPAPHP